MFYYNDIFYVANAAFGYNSWAISKVSDYPMLIITSNPADPDSDGDGFYDGITGDYKPIGFFQTSDKWKLTSSPSPAFYQKDGNYYFQEFVFPYTEVGNRGYYEKSLNLSIDEQNYIYELCQIVNNDGKYEIDPLLVMAICAHETGCQNIINNLGYCGYMQVGQQYVSYYCYGGYRYNKCNGKIEALVLKMIEQNYISQEDYNKLQNNTTSRKVREAILNDPFVCITFGIAILCNNYYSFNDYWKGINGYAGDSSSPVEDYFYRNTLAKLLEEELVYEDKYACEVDYSIIIGNISISL